jgi:hypothetical protein
MAMLGIRRAIALVALLAFGGLILWTPAPDLARSAEAGLALRVLLLPLAVTVIGIARGWYWSRWIALAAALAVLPWATVLVLTPAGPGFRSRAAVALFASLLLLGSLLGRLMFSRYEGSGRHGDWTGARMALVRWSLIFNLASLLNLYLFVAVYRYRVQWHMVIPAVVLLSLLVGSGFSPARRPLDSWSWPWAASCSCLRERTSFERKPPTPARLCSLSCCFFLESWRPEGRYWRSPAICIGTFAVRPKRVYPTGPGSASLAGAGSEQARHPRRGHFTWEDGPDEYSACKCLPRRFHGTD